MQKKIVVFAGNECSVEKEKYYYPLAYKTGKLLAKSGFTVVTGGGEGLMNEVMRGAFEAGGKTIGIRLNIAGRKHSEFVTKTLLFSDLNARQEEILRIGDGYLTLPGGVGTLYEMFAVLALKRKGELSERKPLIIIDGYYKEFEILMNKMYAEGFAEKKINSFYKMVDSPEEAVEKLKRIISP